MSQYNLRQTKTDRVIDSNLRISSDESKLRDIPTLFMMTIQRSPVRHVWLQIPTGH